MGPVFFQTVVGAVIPFEIAIFSLMYLAFRRQKRTQAASAKCEQNILAIVSFFIAFGTNMRFSANNNSFEPSFGDVSGFDDHDPFRGLSSQCGKIISQSRVTDGKCERVFY